MILKILRDCNFLILLIKGFHFRSSHPANTLIEKLITLSGEKNMMTIAQLETEIFALPIQERTTLVQRLLLSLEEISESEFETLWADESAQRAARFDVGQIQAISGAEVAKKARALLQ